MGKIGRTLERRTDILMVVLNNLYPYSTYDVSVAAINMGGESAAVSAMQTTNISSMYNIYNSVIVVKTVIVF